MRMPRPRFICLGLIVLAGTPALAQMTNSSMQIGGPMLIPPPVSGQAFEVEGTSQERSNYLRGGIAFTSAYSDNVLGDINGHAESDITYSIAPTVNLDETTSRLHLGLNYAPGFTFYQRESVLNQADQNAGLTLLYRLSPGMTISASDRFQKTSNVFDQPDLISGGTVSGGTQTPNFSVIAPTADQLNNSGTVGLNDQFAHNAMIGVSGSFSNLHFANTSQVPGLSDSESQSGAAFISLRASDMHYFGALYQYQRILSFPLGISDETQTHAALLFYSLYPTSHISVSLFGGPQYSITFPVALPQQTPTSEVRAWTPAAGASLSVQGKLTGFAMSYSRSISSGAGLGGAVHMDSAIATLRQQITRTLSGSLSGGYTNNELVGGALPFTDNGHTIQATAALQQRIGQNLNVGLGYTRLHQTYSNVEVISQVPNTNREFVSVSYQFSKALGR